MREDQLRPSNPRSPRWFRVGVVLAGIASVTGLALMIVKAISMVSSGRGLETYRTFWLVEDNWVGFLVFVIGAVVALALGLLSRHSERRLWRELESKYGGGGHDGA